MATRRKRCQRKQEPREQSTLLQYFTCKNLGEKPNPCQGDSNENLMENRSTKSKNISRIKRNNSSACMKLEIEDADPIVISSDENVDNDCVVSVPAKRRKKNVSGPTSNESVPMPSSHIALKSPHCHRTIDSESLHCHGTVNHVHNKSLMKKSTSSNREKLPDTSSDELHQNKNCTKNKKSENDSNTVTENIFPASKDNSEGRKYSPEPDENGEDKDPTKKVAYYLLNFQQVLDTVLSNEDDLCLFKDTEDIDWIEKFQRLPAAAKKLFVRLYHRKLAWLRMDQIRYPNIADSLVPVLERLCDNGFLLDFSMNNHNDLDSSDILKLLPAPSLRDLAKSFRINVNGQQKTQIIEALIKMCSKQQSVLSGFFGKKSKQADTSKTGMRQNVIKAACKLLGPCYKLAKYPRRVFNRILLVFDVTRGIDDETDCSLTGSQNAMGQGRHLQLSAMLMAGMGKVQYPEYKVHRPTPIFQRRDDLLHYELAFQFQSDILSCIEAGQWQEAAALCENANTTRIDMENSDTTSCQYAENLPEFLRCFTAQWTYARIRSLEVEILQRLKDYKKAVEVLEEMVNQNVYCSSRRGYWWERLALNYDQHLKNPEKALAAIQASLKDPDVRVGHKLALALRVKKILSSRSTKKQKSNILKIYEESLKPLIDDLEIKEPPVVEITGRLLPNELQTGKSRFVTTEVDNSSSHDETESTLICSVEELVLSHHRALGYDKGIHGEGGTFSTLFCLLMWDIIFNSDVPDVFRTNYQSHPLDLHTDNFYLRRQNVIENRLSLLENLRSDDSFKDCETMNEDCDLENLSVLQLMFSAWTKQYGKACAGLNWERFSSYEEIKGLVVSIGGKVLSGIFRRLAKDLRHTRSGLPDLVIWNSQTLSYKFIEVKGPGDRLSTNQKLWIDELIRLNANIEVCKVIAIGGKRLPLRE